MKPAVVYISYDGMLEPLGQSQVLAYLERLSDDHDIHLISFEKKHDRNDAGRVAAMGARIRAAGIEWHPKAYHKSPSAAATAFDILVGIILTVWLVVRYRAAVVHARSYVPAAIALVAKKLTGVKFIFDIRGFWADERVDGGIWRRGSLLYRVTKRLERSFFRAADHVVVLTEASRREIDRFPYMQGHLVPISVIPTCTDTNIFRYAGEKSGPFTLGYVGSVGTWYLLDEVLAAFKVLRGRVPDARLLIVNRSEHGLIRTSLGRFDINPESVDLVAADHRDVPAFISRMHAGAAFVKPAYSKMATAPTKLAEYLACGVPCLGDAATGDMQEIVEGNRVGVIVREFTDEARRGAIDHLIRMVADPTTSQRCIDTATRLFSLDIGVARYRSIYERLLPQPRSENPVIELAKE